MRKIAIVSIYSFNYGNRLQNYALERVLSEYGKCKTLHISRNANNPIYIAKKLVHLLRGRESGDMCTRFDLRLHFSHKQGKRAAEYFDYFVAGSDQIWNPNYYFNTDREFLTFAQKRQRATYAASIGIDRIPEEQVGRFKKNISEIPHISMREERGAQLVKELTGRDVPVVLDPTMLLSSKEWRAVSKRSKYRPNKKYIFIYGLGSDSMNPGIRKWIHDYAQEKDMEIVSVKAVNSRINMAIGPSEFLDLIDNAQIVFTDSFHATVFSILFRTNFWVLSRREVKDGVGNMYSRLETLLDMFNLKGRMLGGGESNGEVQQDCNFEAVDSVLAQKKKFAREYIESIFAE